jgi:hypothetical protein
VIVFGALSAIGFGGGAFSIDAAIDRAGVKSTVGVEFCAYGWGRSGALLAWDFNPRWVVRSSLSTLIEFDNIRSGYEQRYLELPIGTAN